MLRVRILPDSDKYFQVGTSMDDRERVEMLLFLLYMYSNSPLVIVSNLYASVPITISTGSSELFIDFINLQK